jgi:protein TonB
MAFTDQKNLKQRSAGMAGALIIPGALGALLVTGLAVTGIVRPEPDTGFEGVNIPLPPPPPPKPPETPPEQASSLPKVVTPVPPVRLDSSTVDIDTTPILPPITSDVVRVVPPIDLGPPAMPSIKPAIASPRNDPGQWVTTNDYRSSWILREYAGTARFDLSVSASGRVTDCRITRSTGHSALDDATCTLIAKRARFKPATDASGNKIAGSYSSAIRWVLPD